MKHLSIILLAFAGIFFLGTASAGTPGAYYQTGTISDHTTTPSGLMIWFADQSVPTNCSAATAAPWMLIPEANKTMIAATLLAIAMNNRTVTVYTSGAPPITSSSGAGPTGLCTLTQVDPTN